MEFPGNADMRPPREFMQPFGDFFYVVFIKYQKKLHSCEAKFLGRIESVCSRP
jgi:hypothetical protein